MKRLLSILIMFAAIAVNAQIISGTLTVTNTATNGQTITLNGTARTWTNVVTVAATQIQTGSNLLATVTNLFAAYAAKPTVSVSMFQLSSNAIVFRSYPGSSLTLSASSGWATVGIVTNATTNALSFIPYPVGGLSPTELSNVANAVIDILNSGTTNYVHTNSQALRLFLH